jgi:hypothetical protein
MRNEKTLKAAAPALVGFHFLTVVLHSIAHEVLQVKATPAQLAFIVPVIIFAPVAAGFLLLKFERAGAYLLTVSMIGSFFFGLYYHFIARTIDHVSHVASLSPAAWSNVFIATAYLLSFSEIFGAFAGLFILINGSPYFRDYEARTDF